jgi:hypothetical protein
MAIELPVKEVVTDTSSINYSTATGIVKDAIRILARYPIPKSTGLNSDNKNT